jgi:hypothetical protein
MKKLILSTTIAISSFASAFAQIPNNSFENWTSMGSYSNPDNWDQLNAMTSSMSVYTCTQGTPGNPGNSYLKLTSKTVAGMGVMPGIAVTGTINMSTFKATGGFSCTQRPQSLTGAWQYMASGTDKGFIAVYLTNWNTTSLKRDTVAMAMQNLNGMAMSWANFSVPLMYMNGNYPDSAQIILSASGKTPANGSMLYVDNLAFAGSVAGITENKNKSSDFTFYPNPAKDILNLNYTLKSNDNAIIKITDITGKTVKEYKPASSVIGSNTQNINVNDLSGGVYFISIQTQNSITTKRLIID